MQTAYDAAGVATLSGDRRDATVTLQGGSRWPAGTILSIGSEQAWREGAASSWQRSKEGVVVKSGCQFLNATLDYLEAASKNLELANERFHTQDQRRDGIGILSKSAGAGEEIETLAKAFFTAAAVSRPKGVEGRGPRFAKRLQRWPSEQEVAIHRPPEILAQEFKGLRKVKLEKGLEPIGEHGAFIDKSAPMFDQAPQVAHWAAGSFERPQLAMIMKAVASDHRRIGAIAVRVAHREAATITAHSRWVERVNNDSLELAEEDDEVGRGLFKGDHNARIGRAAVAPSLDPRMERGGIRAHFPSLNEPSGAIEHREIKLFVGSVDADKECIGDVHGVGVVLVLTARTQAGDSNIGWLLPASEKSLRQGHSWQGKPVSSKSSRGPVVTALPLPGRHIFPTSNPLLRRRPTSHLFTLRRAQNVNNFFSVG